MGRRRRRRRRRHWFGFGFMGSGFGIGFMGLGLGLFGFGVGGMGWVWVGFSICALRVLRMDCFPVYVHSGYLKWVIASISMIKSDSNGSFSNIFEYFQ